MSDPDLKTLRLTFKGDFDQAMHTAYQPHKDTQYVLSDLAEAFRKAGMKVEQSHENQTVTAVMEMETADARAVIQAMRKQYRTYNQEFRAMMEGEGHKNPLPLFDISAKRTSREESLSISVNASPITPDRLPPKIV